MTRKSSAAAMRIVLPYLILAGLYILLSDRLVEFFVQDRAMMTRISVYKGWAFVGVTAGLLFLLLSRELAKREDVCARLEQEVEIRTKSEMEVKASEGMWQSTFNAMSDTIWVLDVDCRIKKANQATKSVFGLSPWEVVGRFCHEVAHHSQCSILDCPLGRMRESGKREQTVLLEGDRWIHVLVEPIHDEEGHLCGAVHIVRDITERKALQEQLAMQKVRLQELVDHIPACIYEADWNGRIVLANRKLAEVLGAASPEKLLGRSRDEVMPSELARQHAASDATVIREERIIETEESLSLPDGVHTYHTIRFPIVDADLGCTMAASISTDITSRMRLERMMRSRMHLMEFASTHTLEELLTATLDEAEKATGSLIGFYHFVDGDQAHLTLQAWSTRTTQEFCQIQNRGLHYAIDEAGVWVDAIRERQPVIHNDYPSMPGKKGLPAGHAALVRELVAPILRDDKVVAILGVGNKAVPYTSEDLQTVIYYADMAWDIVAGKQAADELLQSQKRYRILFESSADAIALLRKSDGRFLDVNQAFISLYQYSWEELKGMTPLDISAEPAETEATMNSGVRHVPERWHRKKDGSLFPVEIMAAQPDYPGQEVLLLNIRDISEAWRGRNTLRQQQERLEEMVAQRTEELEAFTYSVSHDLRAPLRSLTGFSGALLEDYAEALPLEASDYCRRIQEGARGMETLIEVLLRLSRISRSDLAIEAVDLATLAKSVMRELQERESGTLPELVVPETLLVHGDPVMLRVMLENLLGNALKFTRERPKGRIELLEDGERAGHTVFCVRDNGVGFPPGMAEKIFTPFQRAHPQNRYPGSGIGLAIVSRIAMRHGGNAWAQSQDGQGAAFFVSLPRIKEGL